MYLTRWSRNLNWGSFRVLFALSHGLLNRWVPPRSAVFYARLTNGFHDLAFRMLRKRKISGFLRDDSAATAVKHRREGFTLIEVLIVVVIMAVLAATIIPQFGSAARDAQVSTAQFNVHSLRNMLDLYRLHHAGTSPTGSNNLEQLVKATNQAGVVGAAGTSFPYGPYLRNSLPINPITKSAKVTLFTGAGMPTASGTTDAGWIYRPATGEIWIDDASLIAF